MSEAGRFDRNLYRKQKEVEEARKAGTLAPAVDKNGNMINPHMPEYMSKAPWYLHQDASDGLEFQRLHTQEEKPSINDVQIRGGFTKQATKYRKGACKNCGSMTHKTEDCVELPRRRGAYLTNQDIQPDEYIAPKRKETYDSKRDRYDGVDVDEVMKDVTSLYETANYQEKKRKIDELNNKFYTENDDDNKRFCNVTDKKTENIYNQNTLVDNKDIKNSDNKYVMAPTSNVLSENNANLRNMRSTAKYLLNLDINSAYYDPKTRSMRANPYEGLDRKPDEVNFLGENYLRSQGEVKDFAKATLFQMTANANGQNINLITSPTATLLLQKQYEERKTQAESNRNKIIEDKYKVDLNQNTNIIDDDLLLGQTENYNEYDENGNVIKGRIPTIPTSKYEEDIYPGNHTSIYGSWYDKEHKQWGYACCKQTIKNAYCMVQEQ